MSGSRIEMAKQSLVLFLKSLPKTAYFNIITFGSRFKPLFETAKKVTEQLLSSTI